MPKSHLNDLPELRYYILSLKWSPSEGVAVWWRPDNAGYTTDLNRAGRYTREQVETKPHYYNDGVETLAVLESVAINNSTMVRTAEWNGADWWREKTEQ